MKIEQGLYYTTDHEWIKVDGDKARIGITDYAQDKMGDIVFVELPEVDETYSEGDVLCVVESVKAASDVFMPLSGTVTEANEELEDAPESLNEDPYGNWIAEIVEFDTEALEEMMSAEKYEEFIGSLDD
ncbi:glycine cleavage system protein GcvH [Vallitalea okinawensis]|uniref:glycine cleavage system protein GcvH n=1 Tax=Vallitalea okinawensis TaxID=2078660 RepID=UPI000CFD1574|nr:glycine cleavage system protein GcvH [Vallitalea okinawensis]